MKVIAFILARSNLIIMDIMIKSKVPAMHRFAALLITSVAVVSLSGCITSVVTVPAKVAYGTGKLAVKGTAAAVRAVVPNSPDHDYQKCLKDQKKDKRIYCEDLKPQDE